MMAGVVIIRPHYYVCVCVCVCVCVRQACHISFCDATELNLSHTCKRERGGEEEWNNNIRDKYIS